MANEKATYKGVTYSNGNMPKKFRKALAGQSNAYLRIDAAEAWNAAREEALKETGVLLTVRGWDRTIGEQRTFFLERYEPRSSGSGPYGDVRWYNGKRYVRVRGAAAAIPGTSNHGLGLAVDVVDFGSVGQFNATRRVKTIAILKRHGFTDTEGRGKIQEPWHLVYDPKKDQGKKPSGPAKRAPKKLPTLRVGSTGAIVGTLQGRLGVDRDQRFGNITRSALVGHQKQAGGVEPTGVCGERTWMSLIVGNLRQGDKGTKVEILQLIVGVTPDGDFGPKTGAGVEAVQRYLGIAPDRIAGPQFRAAVLKHWTK